MWKCEGTRKAKMILKNKCDVWIRAGCRSCSGRDPGVPGWGQAPSATRRKAAASRPRRHCSSLSVCLSVLNKEATLLIGRKKSATNDANFSLTAHAEASLWWVTARSEKVETKPSRRSDRTSLRPGGGQVSPSAEQHYLCEKKWTNSISLK